MRAAIASPTFNKSRLQLITLSLATRKTDFSSWHAQAPRCILLVISTSLPVYQKDRPSQRSCFFIFVQLFHTIQTSKLKHPGVFSQGTLQSWSPDSRSSWCRWIPSERHRPAPPGAQPRGSRRTWRWLSQTTWL